MVLDSSVLSLLPKSGDGASTLLEGLYRSTGSSGENPVVALASALRQETKAVARTAAEPATKRELAAFRAAVAAARTPAELLANADARKVLLTANGLGDQAQYAALAKKALLSDTTKPGSVAGKLSDPRWLTVAKTYDFANQGLALLKKPGVLDTIASGYAEVRWREGLDASTPGLSRAIDFRSRAAKITSVDQILGDAGLRKVVTTALGIPEQIAFQPLQAQEKAITDRLDITKFKSAAFVEQFTRRYLVAAGTAAREAAGSGQGAGQGAQSSGLFA